MPSLGDRARIPGSLPPVPELQGAAELLERAITLEPAFAPVHAARGNLLLRRGDVAAAQRSFALAARLDPREAAARLALGELAFMRGDETEAAGWFDEAFAITRLFSPVVPRPGTRSALVLSLPGPWSRNVPLDFVVDADRWTLHRWYLPDPSPSALRELPAYDAIVNAIAQHAAAAPALAAARAFLAARGARALNPPELLERTARSALPKVMRGIGGCIVPDARRVRADELCEPSALRGAGGAGYPALVRAADTHGGRSLERVEAPAELGAYLERIRADAYDISAFVDYRSPDGFYRKYRAVFVDGVAYPYHLAIDSAWMIHYHRSPTSAEPWMRTEERRFLNDPAAAVPGWNSALRACGAALGLDYFGIDFAQLGDGRIVLFEADAAMLVHDFDADPHKREAVARIRAALAARLEKQAGA